MDKNCRTRSQKNVKGNQEINLNSYVTAFSGNESKIIRTSLHVRNTIYFYTATLKNNSYVLKAVKELSLNYKK